MFKMSKEMIITHNLRYIFVYKNKMNIVYSYYIIIELKYVGNFVWSKMSQKTFLAILWVFN